MINIIIAVFAITMVVIFVFIFVTDLGMELLVRLEIFGKEKFGIFGYEILRQPGQTVENEYTFKLDFAFISLFYYGHLMYKYITKNQMMGCVIGNSLQRRESAQDSRTL